MTTHSSVLALRIPGTGEPGGLQSMGSHRVRHDWSDLAELDLNCNALLQKDPQMQWPVYDRSLFLSHIEVQKTLSQNWQAHVPQNPRGPWLQDQRSLHSISIFLHVNKHKKKSGVLSLRIWPSSYMHCTCSVTKLCPTLCDPMDCSPPNPQSMWFLRQKYRSGLPFPSPGDFSHPGIEPVSPALADRFLTTEQHWKPQLHSLLLLIFLLAWNYSLA